MSLLSDLQTIAESCGVSVETGVFSGKAPDTYPVSYTHLDVYKRQGTIKDPQRVRESWQSTFGGSGNARCV